MLLLLCIVFVVIVFVIVLLVGVFILLLLLLYSWQVIVVVIDSWDVIQGWLQVYECWSSSGLWCRYGFVFIVVVGWNGSVWGVGCVLLYNQGLQKQEGDGCSFVGIFEIGFVFGYVLKIVSVMLYQLMMVSYYCMDVFILFYYNCIVDVKDVGVVVVEGFIELMWLDLYNKGDVCYCEGFVIEYNSSCMFGRGSCIFVYFWCMLGEVMVGCMVMELCYMKVLLVWLKLDMCVVFILLLKMEYDNLQVLWQLLVLIGVMY